MHKFIEVGYDLHNPDRDYPRIEQGIRSLGPAIRVLQSQWQIQTSLGCHEVERYLRNFVDANDTLRVSEVLNSVTSGPSAQRSALATALARGISSNPAQYGLNRLALLSEQAGINSAKAAAGLLGEWK